jgi:hypothetical protein
VDKLPEELLEICIASDPVGTIRRARHLYKIDGSECSVSLGKDFALVSQRINTGWLYLCHRCGFKGALNHNKSTPSDILKRIKGNTTTCSEEPETNKIELPNDLISIYNKDNFGYSENFPDEARKILLRNRMEFLLVSKYGIKYSTGYKRIIVPANATILQREILCKQNMQTFCGPANSGDLIAWVGRNPFHRKDSLFNSPKWLVRKSKYLSPVVFHLQAYNRFSNTSGQQDYTILVEDVFSAIRVFESLNGRANVIALLGTNLPTILIQTIKTVIGGEIVIWLDHDALAKAIKYWQKSNSLELNPHI